MKVAPSSLTSPRRRTYRPSTPSSSRRHSGTHRALQTRRPLHRHLHLPVARRPGARLAQQQRQGRFGLSTRRGGHFGEPARGADGALECLDSLELDPSRLAWPCSSVALPMPDGAQRPVPAGFACSWSTTTSRGNHPESSNDQTRRPRRPEVRDGAHIPDHPRRVEQVIRLRQRI